MMQVPASKQPQTASPKETVQNNAPASTTRQTTVAARFLDPDALTPETVEALQATHGNHFVQRLLARKTDPQPVPVTNQSPPSAVQRNGGPLPTIDHLPAMAQTLLEGALEKDTINEAVLQIYDNMFKKTGWKYNASIPNVNGKSYIDGSKTVGMCESYRNAFAAILGIYDELRKNHPTDAVKNGALAIENGDDLVAAKFYTKTGLTLMGTTALKGNVYLQVDGEGKTLQEGLDTVNTFIFKGHWTLKVNGTEYDPIFYAPGVATLGKILDANYSDGTARFLADVNKPIPTSEFGATFMQVTDFPAFAARVKAISDFYTANQQDIDWMLQSNFLERWMKGMFVKKNADIVRSGKRIFDAQVTDKAGFQRLFDAAYKAMALTRDQKTAYDKVKELASV
jgi:hypothetical protein